MKASHLFRFFRFYDWYYDVAILTMVGFLAKPEPISLSLFMLFLTALYGFGFLVNSYADRRPDRISGKASYIYLFPKSIVVTLMAIFAAGAIAAALALDEAWLGAILILLALTYSLPPVRWKERGFIGFLALVLTILPLPYLLFAFSQRVPLAQLLPIFAWLFSLSFTNAIAHHYSDIDSDHRSGTKTWATALGKAPARRVYAWSLAITVLLPLVFFAVLSPVPALLHFLVCELLLVYPLNEFFDNS